MTTAPPTRHSLILRLRDREDAAAWQEFADIYEPVIYRVATGRGMQHADALELVQRVLMSVARAVDRFQPDPKRAKFRTWLHTITHNEFCRQYAKSEKQPTTGDSAIRELVDALPAESTSTADDFSIEYRRAVFRWAAAIVKQQVTPSTWEAFWRTRIEDESTEAVAADLSISIGAVYIARSRVMARLQQQATEYEEQP